MELYSRRAYAGNVVVHGGACACTYTTPNLHQPEPGLHCINGVLSNLPSFVAWVVAMTQTSSKINIRPRCFAWKEWTQNSNCSPNIFFSAKCNLCGWCWPAGTAVMGSIYELWCHNGQGQRNLAYNLNTTYHTTYKAHTY